MEFFHKAKAVQLRSHHGKYLVSLDDEESVKQDRNGQSKGARWTVEFVTGSDAAIRLKSYYNKYLTASTEPFLIGLTGRKILQTLPSLLDSTVEWEPIKDGNHIRLKSRYSHSFLRANGRVPPWRNSVTHYTADETQKSALEWDVDIVEINQDTMTHNQPPPPQAPQLPGKGKTPAAPRPHAPRQSSNANLQKAQLAVATASLAVGVTGPLADDHNKEDAAVDGDDHNKEDAAVHGDDHNNEDAAVDGDAGIDEEAVLVEDWNGVEEDWNGDVDTTGDVDAGGVDMCFQEMCF